MTFKELTYSVLEIITGFNFTDDSEFSIKQVEEVMLGMNATLVREAFTNKQISQSLYVTDELLSVEKIIKSVVIDGVPIASKAKLCKVDLKALVQGIGWKDVIYFGTPDLSADYTRKSFRGLVDSREGTVWPLGKPYYALLGNTAYLETVAYISSRFVTVEGIWRDPREASGYSETMEFPTPSEYKLQMLTIKHLFIGKNVPPDLINNAQRQVTSPQQARQPRVREEARKD